MAGTSSTFKSEGFSNVDAAWLHMETPTNMAMITGIMAFDQPLSFDRLRAVVENRLLAYERFTQHVREPSLGVGLPRWETDPDMDINWHLQQISLPEPAGQEELQELVGELMSTPLDFDRPLWQFHYVENYGQGSALVCRLHHCIADGIALMQVLLSMTDESPDAPPGGFEEKEPSRPKGRLARLLLPAVRTARLVDRSWKTTRLVVQGGMNLLVNPSRALDVARLSLRGTRALGKLLLIPPDRQTLFKGKCDVTKRAAWTQPLDLNDVKAVGRLMGATVNDVLLSAVTGALRRYLEDRGEPVEGLNFRAVVPVSIRPPEDFDKLGNRFGLVFLSLPVGVRDYLRRLRILKRRMDAIKQSPEAVVAFGILNAIGMTPVQIENVIVTIFGMKGTAVMTNVPGPQKRLYLAGGELSTLMFWVPQPGNLGLGVSILSYAGEVIVGVATDAGLVPDPDQIVAAFHDEFNAMKSWGRPEPKVDSASETVSTPVDPGAGSQLYEQEVEPSPGSGLLDAVDGRCMAFTRSGKRCKNRALPGRETCRVHQPT